MSNHTPGPWRVLSTRETRVGGPRITAEGSTPFRSVAIADVWGNEDETLANARLIAAAPELLEAIKLCVATLDGNFGPNHRNAPAIDAAVAVIAKAEGRE